MNLLNTERAFAFNELFFSRTNHRGIIQSGNSVFQRISNYNWEDMLQKPHSLIRHPDMPRGVFYLFWEELKSGHPIGAYVKNLAQDKQYYWVYALALPLTNTSETDFISMRLKPSSKYFDITKELYKKILKLEENQKLTPKQSAEIILQEIQKLGFNTYQSFMTEALITELESRQNKIGLPAQPITEQLRSMVEYGSKISDRTTEVKESHALSRFIPLNLQVQANRLGQDGSSIAIVANQYEEMTSEIQNEMIKFTEASQVVAKMIEKAQFIVSAGLSGKEVIEFFKKETVNEHINSETEIKILDHLLKNIHIDCKNTLLAVSEVFSKLKTVNDSLTQLITGLEIVRLTGRTEVAKINTNRKIFESLIEDLSKFRESLKVSLQEVDDLSIILKNLSDDILNHFKI